jgi:hypothetical protein
MKFSYIFYEFLIGLPTFEVQNKGHFKGPRPTVGRRVDFNPKSDSSKLCFLGFYSIVNTPTKKKSQQKTPFSSPLFRY